MWGLDQKSAVQNSQPSGRVFDIKNSARGTKNSGPRFSGLGPHIYIIFMILTDACQLLTSFLAKSFGYSFALLGMFPFAPLVTSSLRSHSFCSDEIFVSPAAICRQVSPDLVCFRSTERHLSGFRRSRISVTKEKSRVSRASIKGVLPLLGTWNEAP